MGQAIEGDNRSVAIYPGCSTTTPLQKTYLSKFEKPEALTYQKELVSMIPNCISLHYRSITNVREHTADGF